MIVLPAFPRAPPGDVTDLLLLATLPFRRITPIMLFVDSFECLPMLSFGSLAVAPLRPVDVGEGCILWEEDREGTCNRLRFLLGASEESFADNKVSSSPPD